MFSSLFRQPCALAVGVVLGGALVLSGCGGGSGGSTPTVPPTGDPSVLLDEEFNSGSLNTGLWETQGTDYQIQRTLFGNQVTFGSDGNTSYVRLPLSTYVSSATARANGNVTYGTEIGTRVGFPQSQGLRFDARIRFPSAAQQGLVGGFFLFSRKGTFGGTGTGTEAPMTIDEIDHELLTTAYAKPSSYTWTNVYNDFVLAQPAGTNGTQGGHYDDTTTTLGLPEPTAPGFKLDDWNLYRIEWRPASGGNPASVQWFINDMTKPIRTDTSGRVPDSSLGVRFNLWAANSSWSDAYSNSPVLNGVTDSSQAQNFYLDVDYVKVSTLDGKAPTTSGLKRASSPIKAAMADYRGK